MRQTIENKLLVQFYDHPEKEFTIRELSKLSRLPRATVHKHLKSLKEEGLVDKTNKAAKNYIFKTKKINYYIEKIAYSGLIDFLIERFNPSCIILFGSIRKGDSIKESDVDIFIESSVTVNSDSLVSLPQNSQDGKLSTKQNKSNRIYHKNEINLEKYERKIGHKIQLLIEPNIVRLNENLLNNVVNGIKLYGSFKIK